MIIFSTPVRITPLNLTVSFFTLLLLIAKPAASLETNTLKLAASPWCPYTCDYKHLPGYATQYIKALLGKKKIKVSIDNMSWENALQRTQNGDYQGIVTVSPGETSNILFTSVPTDSYQSCFYTLNENQWQYHGLESLQNIKLGVMQSYIYGQPLDGWLTNNSKQIYVSGGTDKLGQLIDQLKNHHINSFIHDRNVLSHYLHRKNAANIILKEAGCLAASGFYFGLKPETPNAREIIAYLDAALAAPENQKLKHFFKQRYGLGKYFSQYPLSSR